MQPCSEEPCGCPVESSRPALEPCVGSGLVSAPCLGSGNVLSPPLRRPQEGVGKGGQAHIEETRITLDLLSPDLEGAQILIAGWPLSSVALETSQVEAPKERRRVGLDVRCVRRAVQAPGCAPPGLRCACICPAGAVCVCRGGGLAWPTTRLAAGHWEGSPQRPLAPSLA